MKLQDDLIVMAYCNSQGIIEEIIYYNNHAKKNLEIGESIFQKVPMDNHQALSLKRMLERKDQFFDFVLMASSGDLEKRRVMHGFPMNKGYLVLIEEEFYCDERSRDSYEEIMKLNSELTNAQREVAKKNQELKRMNEKLETLVTKDALTGLFNRYALKEKYEEGLKRSKRRGIKFSIAMVDFNNFKKVNDELGHGAGDQLLKDFARLSIEETRTGFDFVFRIGGDEFLFLFEDCTKEETEQIILRIERKLEQYTRIATLAYGAMEVPIEEDPRLEKLLKQVDEKMYRNKRKKQQNNKQD